MIITVVGLITKDSLIFTKPNFRIVESLGGTLYIVSALASLSKNNDKIRLVCNIGYDIYEEVIEYLQLFPNIDLSSINKVDSKNIHSYILFASEYGSQYDEGHEIPITYKQIEPFIYDTNFIIISSMTGFDFNLSTLKRIKNNAKCPIYFDYHILALDRDAYGNRFFKKRINWLAWCTSCDHLQLNELEAEFVFSKSISNVREMKIFSEFIFKYGVKSIAVTLGENGSLVSWLNKMGSIQVEQIVAVTSNKVIDATGCGDTFAASFVIKYCQTGDFLFSYTFANKISSMKTSFHGFIDFSNYIKQNCN